ncbi:MAG: phosphoadenosine phosphosulfate reductase family protein [Acidobacteria bacterium]|nr:phosphoadenosine phosphosulfate reductase family protein [Acidobacteriota bacterium]
MLRQVYNNKSVLVAARERISFVFDNFENIIVSISGGKDSTVLAHLALQEARRRSRKINLFFLDEEVVYQSTIDQIEYLMALYPENTNRLWLQIEFRLTNATSVEEGQLICWEAGRHKDWMRPKKSWAIQHRMWALEEQTVRDKNKGFGFYDVIENFERCYQNTAFLVGERATESPNRWRSVAKNPVNINGQQIYWGTRRGANWLLKPICDWNFHDVWRYIWDEKLRYSKIYDYQFKKGYSINEMRVSSLIHERSFKSICDLPEFEPKTYAKLCKRIKGIQFAQETGKNAKMFRARKLPKNYKSWVTYRDFLLDTYPDASKKPIFVRRFARHLTNEFVARQQCRQLILNDYENNLPVENVPDPREATIRYYMEVL